MSDFLGFDFSSIDYRAWLDATIQFLLPRLIQSGLQLLAAGIVYYLARWLLRRLESRFASRTETTLDDIVVELVRRLVLMSVGFWAVWRVALIWNLPTMAAVVGGAWIVGLSLPISRAAGALIKVLETNLAKTGTKLDDTALPWINRTITGVIVGTAALLALFNMNIDITPLLAGASIAGVAISFAAKDTLSNLIAGVLLILDRPFEVGDRIELWSAPARQSTWGDVTEIGIRATKIRTPDNILIIIPNNQIMQRDIINYTASGPTIRLRIPIGIGYDADVEEAKKLCLEVAADNEQVEKSPKSVCILRAFGASSVDLELRVWLKDGRQRRAVEDTITEQIKLRFNAAGIEIPYPKRDLYIRQAPVSIVARESDG